MADLKLDILVIPTYNTLTLGIADASTYPDSPPVSSPSIQITIPGFGIVTLPFNMNDFNVFNSTSLGLTDVGVPLTPLPDGAYTLTYSVSPAYLNYVTKTFYRVEQLQQKFDEAFMKLDMIQCDMAIKKQQMVDLNTIYFFIQGAIAAANNCATKTADTLYQQASRMLTNFIKSDCGCSGTNYLTNFN